MDILGAGEAVVKALASEAVVQVDHMLQLGHTLEVWEYTGAYYEAYRHCGSHGK